MKRENGKERKRENKSELRTEIHFGFINVCSVSGERAEKPN
jgi:hypothetical protein